MKKFVLVIGLIIIVLGFGCNKIKDVALEKVYKPMSDVNGYFSSDYKAARKKFLNAGKKVNARIFKLVIDNTGPNNENLTIDIAWIGNPNPRRVIVHTSGLHGVEGFAGSAIQLKALEDLQTISEDGALVFVHVLNPYGMAWLRRFNENNVDLNRNFLKPNEPWPGIPKGYRQVNDFLNPQTPPSNDFFYLQLFFNIIKFGYQPMKKAIVSGQYDYPKGIFFGGKKLQQGALLYKEWLKRSFSSANHIFVIDVHTGLGKWCQETLFHRIEGTDHNAISDVLKKQLIREYKYSEVLDYEYTGGHRDLYEEIFPGKKIDFITQEFGTISIIKVLYALREENRFYHYGDNKLDHRTKERLKRAFYPDALDWKSSILDSGIYLINKTSELVFK